MDASDDRWSRQIRGLREGDDEIVYEFCTQYGPSLERIAGTRMASGLRRRVDPEDVVQSVFRTFLRRAAGGQFQLDDSESLWRLLCAITLTKVREQARFQLRQKRGLQREVPLDPGSTRTEAPAYDAAAPGPSPAEIAEFSEQFENLLGDLDEEERQIVDLKLQDRTQESIADALGCSERTVRRLLRKLEARLEASLDG